MDEPELPIKLTPDELIEQGDIMATKVLHVDALRRKKAEDSKATQKLIDAELTELARLSRVRMDGVEMRKQGDLKFEPTQDEATEALAKVAAAASDGKPLPGEPHEFQGEDGSRPCGLCGSGCADEVHRQPGPISDHQFVGREDDLEACVTCNEPRVDHAIIAAGQAAAPAPDDDLQPWLRQVIAPAGPWKVEEEQEDEDEDDDTEDVEETEDDDEPAEVMSVAPPPRGRSRRRGANA